MCQDFFRDTGPGGGQRHSIYVSFPSPSVPFLSPENLEVRGFLSQFGWCRDCHHQVGSSQVSPQGPGLLPTLADVIIPPWPEG